MRYAARHYTTSLALLVFSVGLDAHAEDAPKPDPKAVALFEKQVKPILQNHCYRCHSHAANKHRGGLVVDSRGALLKGGDSGPALVPGDTKKSLLFQAIHYGSDDLKMPPAGKISEAEINLVKQWIELGAPWPGSEPKKGVRVAGGISAEDRDWWAFRPVKAVPPPRVDDAAWTANPIDRFILDRMLKEGVRPAPEADARTLVRRVHFDLVGLPPTPAEVDDFLKKYQIDPQRAYEDLVDRLLDDPRYGERWARHWLDIVRYAESDGFRQDAYRPTAWRYRDYVIRSFNQDRPYDEFVRQQLAGDEIAPQDPDALAATGFLRLWIYEFNQRDVRTQWNNILNDITDVTADVFLAMGMGCARCHDHKYDPLLQKDYYRLQAFFAPIQFPDDVPVAPAEQVREYRRKLAAWEKSTADVRSKIDTLLASLRKSKEKDVIEKFQPDLQAILVKPDANRTPHEKQIGAMAERQFIGEGQIDNLGKFVKDPKTKKQLEALEKELAKFAHLKPAPLPTALTVCDVGPTAPPTVLPRKGNKEELQPGFFTVLGEELAKVRPTASSTGRRKALAEWITRSDNPLTARVIVNRMWQHHFGRGLVDTPSDFGKLGEPPTHPELLDWLAETFVQDGWSLKKMHRRMVTSRTYRQASLAAQTAASLKKDPDNRWWGRMEVRRLDAEQIRDAMLLTTGKLDPKSGGPSVDGNQPRRSIYLKVRRNTMDPLMEVFDAPDGLSSMPQRNVSTTATQALYMLNSGFMAQQAKAFAARLLKAHAGDDAGLVRAAFRLAYGRSPEPEENERVLRFLGTSGPMRREALEDFCQVLFNSNEFVYVD